MDLANKFPINYIIAKIAEALNQANYSSLYTKIIKIN